MILPARSLGGSSSSPRPHSFMHVARISVEVEHARVLWETVLRVSYEIFFALRKYVTGDISHYSLFAPYLTLLSVRKQERQILMI